MTLALYRHGTVRTGASVKQRHQTFAEFKLFPFRRRGGGESTRGWQRCDPVARWEYSRMQWAVVGQVVPER